MEKYIKYLHLKHEYDGINCLTLIERIYQEFLNKSFSSMWKRLGRKDGTTDVSRRWIFKYGIQDIDKESKNWIKINLTSIEEYAIIVFTDRKKRIDHFGMYLSENKFIHCPEKGYVVISELDQDWRDKIYGIYRLKDDSLV